MQNRELKALIQNRAEDIGIKGVMHLTTKCDLNYERVSKVWQGSTSAKLADFDHVASVLGLEVKFVIKGE